MAVLFENLAKATGAKVWIIYKIDIGKKLMKNGLRSRHVAFDSYICCSRMKGKALILRYFTHRDPSLSVFASPSHTHHLTLDQCLMVE